MDELLASIKLEVSNYIQFGLTLLLIVLFFVSKRIVSRLSHRHGKKYDYDKAQIFYVVKLLNFGLVIIFITLISLVWEVSWHGLSVYFVSIFTVIGIGFFAQWSMLSNITASVILFFYFPVQAGKYVKIFEGDNSISGKVLDITMFSIKLKLENGEIISYPNNLAIQKPIVKISPPKSLPKSSSTPASD